jgi:two-component system, NarL family, nitrate/nitrite response regulator NarL
MKESLSVILADSQALFSDALASVLTQRGHRVLAVATTGRALLDAAVRHDPDLCLVDSRLPDGDAIEVIAEIAARRPRTKIVLLTAEDGHALMDRAFAAGAVAYIHKSRGLTLALDSLERVMAGEVVIAASRSLEPAAESPGRKVTELATYLTPRELQCLRLITAGLHTGEMARRLGVSPTTIRSHVQAVLTKLNAHSRTEAASLAIRYGLVPVDRDVDLGEGA